MAFRARPARRPPSLAQKAANSEDSEGRRRRGCRNGPRRGGGSRQINGDQKLDVGGLVMKGGVGASAFCRPPQIWPEEETNGRSVLTSSQLCSCVREREGGALVCRPQKKWREEKDDDASGKGNEKGWTRPPSSFRPISLAVGAFLFAASSYAGSRAILFSLALYIEDDEEEEEERKGNARATPV